LLPLLEPATHYKKRLDIKNTNIKAPTRYLRDQIFVFLFLSLIQLLYQFNLKNN